MISDHVMRYSMRSRVLKRRHTLTGEYRSRNVKDLRSRIADRIELRRQRLSERDRKSVV